MNEKIIKLKKFIRDKASNSDFPHNSWFVKWHLEIVEKISDELLQYYPDADKDTVRVMTWMHDYGKIVGFDSQFSHDYIESGCDELLRLGFNAEFINRVAENIKTLDAKINLNKAPIEVQIVSSADGCSHLVGPFIRLYWLENSHQPYEKIMAENIRKLTVDWDKKIVLPEVRRAFQQRHDVAIEQSGALPGNFICSNIEFVDSVNFYVTSVEDSVAFYSGKMGFKLAYRQGNDYASFTIGQINLGLKRATEDREKPGSQTIILGVTDAHKKYEDAVHDSLTIHHALSDDVWGEWFSVADPDDNIIEYLERK